MKVLGYEIEEHVIDHALASLDRVKGFRLSDLRAAILTHQAHISPGIADRCADRVLQRLRKRGDIEFKAGWWRVTQEPNR